MSVKDFFLAITPSLVLKALNRLGWYMPDDEIPEVPIVVKEPFEQRGSTNGSVRDLLSNPESLKATTEAMANRKKEYAAYASSLKKEPEAPKYRVWELLKSCSAIFCRSSLNSVRVGPAAPPRAPSYQPNR